MGDKKELHNKALGFVKTTTGTPKTINPEQRAQLLRRGNELFNAGQYDLAERIFTTLGYGDGLLRLGDAFYKKNDYQRALKLYTQAPDPERVKKVCKRMAMVVRQWLLEDKPSQSSHSFVEKEG